MMNLLRPYLAVIKDSFRAATHSYVLWAMLLVVTFMLALLMPFSFGEQLKTELSWSDVPRWHDVATTLHSQSESNPNGPAAHIWQMLDEDVRDGIDEIIERENAPTRDPKDVPENEEEAAQQAEEDAQRRAEGAVIRMGVTEIHRVLQLELDELLAEEDFYDESAWEGIELSDEAQKLVETPASALSKIKLRRRNRLALEAAFPLIIPRSNAVSVRPTYGGKANSMVLALLGAPPQGTTREAVVEWYQSRISILMNWPVTFALVFVGIIATSGIIPRMFDPGSITLLLSKPVSRSWLFLSQYAGGCAFMLLASTYFIVGVWLLAGIRLGVWGPKIFLCIPLFVAIFMVYFAVSALTGLLWRSAIVSVIVVIAFFYLCFGIGMAKNFFDDNQVDIARLTQLHPAGEALMATNDRPLEKQTFFWNADDREWFEVFATSPQTFARTTERLYQSSEGRMVALQDGFQQSLAVGEPKDGWTRRGGIPVPDGTFAMLLDPDDDVIVASRDGFSRLVGDPLYFEKLQKQREQAASDRAAVPSDATLEEEEPGDDLDENTCQDEPSEDEPTEDDDEASSEGESVAADDADSSNESDVSDDTSSPEETLEESADTPASVDENSPADNPTEERPADEQPSTAGEDDQPPRSTDPDAPLPTVDDFFASAGPDSGFPAALHMAVAIDSSDGTIALYGGGVVFTFAPDTDGNYQQQARRELTDSQEKAATLAIGGGQVVIGREDGTVIILATKSLDKISESQPEDKVAVKSIAASPDGQWFAVLFANRRLYLAETTDAAAKLQRASLWTQGDISAATFTADSNLLVADKIARVREVELPSMKVIETYQPKRLPYLSETTEVFGLEVNYFMVHRFIVTPLYTVLPRVGELGWFFRYIMTGDDTQVSWFSLAVGEERHLQRDPWSAVWSCAIFVAVLLAFGCWRIHRAEF